MQTNKILIAINVIGLTFLISCGHAVNDKEDGAIINALNATIDSLQEITDSLSVSPLCDASSHTLKKHVIDTNEAVNYIWMFGQKYGSDPVITYNSWSEISRDSLSRFETPSRGRTVSPADHCGMMFYFCLDSTNKKYYLAYQYNENYYEGDDPFPISSTSLMFNTSTCSKKFKSEEWTDERTTHDALKSFKFICAEPARALSYSEVNKAANDLIIHIALLNPTVLNPIENPVGFFHQNELNAILTQNDSSDDPDKKCKAIRIYWGFHDQPHNKILLMVFGVDARGYNIWTKYDGTDAVILEHSWPPF